jgi:hypothetical protein
VIEVWTIWSVVTAVDELTGKQKRYFYIYVNHRRLHAEHLAVSVGHDCSKPASTEHWNTVAR